jgi:DNA gyrase subunit A
VPTLLWKLIEEIRVGDHVALQRTRSAELGCADWYDTLTGLLLGAFISEGFVSDRRAGFNNLDRDYFNNVVAAYDAVIGGTRYISERTIASGSVLLELDIHNLGALSASPLAELSGFRSADKFIPDRLWNSPTPVKRAFLQALFEGDGSCSALPRNTVQISYSTRSARLATDVHQMLLEFGVLSHRYEHATGE